MATNRCLNFGEAFLKIVFGFQRIEVTWEQILLGLTLQALLEKAAEH
jgi:hypothetical protein